MEQFKARVGEVTRKFIGNDTPSSTKAAGYNYTIPMTECKSFIELDDGEIITDEEHTDMIEAVKLMTTIVQTLKTAIN